MVMTERRISHKKTISVLKIISRDDLDVYFEAAEGLASVRVTVDHRSDDVIPSSRCSSERPLYIEFGQVGIGIVAKGDDIGVFWGRVREALKIKEARRRFSGYYD